MHRYLLSAIGPLFLLAGAPAAHAVNIPVQITFDGQEPIEQEMAATLKGQVADGKLSVKAENPLGGFKTGYDIAGDGPRAATVDVTSKVDAGAGLTGLAGPGLTMREGNGNYLFIVVMPGTFVVRSIVNSDVNTEVVGPLPNGVNLEKGVRIQARETAKGVQFSINGISVASVTDPAVTGHATGIIYFGKGEYTFDNLAMNRRGDLLPGGPGDTPAVEPVKPQADTGPQDNTPAPKPNNPQPVVATSTYFVAAGGKSQGPFSLTELANMQKDGRLLPATPVWRDGMPAWVSARSVPELASLFP